MVLNGLNITNSRQYQAVLGIDNQSLTKLCKYCSEYYKEIHNQSYEQNLSLSPKASSAKIKTLDELVSYVLMIMKGGLTFDFAAFIMQFDQSRAHRQFERGLKIIHDTLFIEGFLPTRSINDPTEFASVFHDTDTIIIDGTDQRIQRPGDYETQRIHFTGKKKTHVYRSLVINNLQKYIYYISEVYVGSSSEISILETEFNPEMDWFSGYKVRVDLGYVGFQKKYPAAELFLPHKKPRGGELTPEQKSENRKLASQRIIVEHSLSGMKRYDILTNQNRNHKVENYNMILATCAGLWNFFITR